MVGGTAEGGTARTPIGPAPWSGPARARMGLAMLASATFVYVTAETLPVGLLPQLSAGLHVRPGTVGLLVTAYAAVAALTAIPLTAGLEQRSRRTVVVGCVGLLALSQFVVAAAPDYAVVLAARILCALAHGVFWSMLGPVAARLAPPGQAGRATALVFAGNSLALVGGVPLGTALGHAVGWRFAMAALGVVAVVSAVALRRVLPPLCAEPAVSSEPTVRGTAGATVRGQLADVLAAFRSGPLLAVCVVTTVAATGQFAAYTYITALVQRDAGLTGLALSAVLFGYGAAGIGGIVLAGRISDGRPRLATAASLTAMVLALALLASLAHGSAVGTVASVALWGAGFTALPVVLQAAVLRVAPRSADTASSLYVVGFQIGIGSGALVGSLMVNAGLLAVLPVAALALASIGLVIVVAARRAFPPRGPGQPAPSRPAVEAGLRAEASPRVPAAQAKPSCAVPPAGTDQP